MSSNVIQLIKKIKEIPADVCATCLRATETEAICVDGDDINLYCWSIDSYVRPFTSCREWKAKP